MRRKKRGIRSEALYMIGVAARLAGMHPQTLRIYERKRLICPCRSAGSTRLYSNEDIEKIKLIQELTGEGVNLAGVRLIMTLKEEILKLEREMEEAEKEFGETRLAMEEEIEKVKRSYRKELVLFPRGKLIKR